MANRYTEDIAEWLLANGANNIHGKTAKEITEALDLPSNAAYRVLRGTGFFKSKLPNYPEGYYYNAKKAIGDLQSDMSIVDLANDKFKAATYMEQKMTDVGKILSQTNIDYSGPENILETIGNIKAPKSYTLQEIKDNVAKARNVKDLKVWLVMCLVAANRNLIVADPKVEE